MMQNWRSRTQLLRKRKLIREVEYVLVLKIYQTIGLTEPYVPYLFCTDKFYKVLSWIDPEDQCPSRMVRTNENPRFNEQFEFPVTAPTDFVNVEVVRLFSKGDPGSSDGVVLVGRTRIKFPKSVGVERKGLAELVRMENGILVPKGHILYSIALVEVQPRDYRQRHC